MDDAAALKRLRTLLKEDGALKIITPFHACRPDDELVTDAQMVGYADDVQQECRAYAEEHGHSPNMPGGYREPGHYRLVEVKRLDEVRGSWRGSYIAYADDELGSSVTAPPAVLLARLTKHEELAG